MENGWINVKDRLPEPGIEVLVVMGNRTMRVAEYSSADLVCPWWDGAFWLECEVKYWQPLPPPPTVGEGG
jgi:hypothetical protein